MIDAADLWEGALRRLDGVVPSFALEAWARPLRPESIPGGVRLVCPSEFHRQRVARYLEPIRRCIAEEARSSLDVALEVRPGLSETGGSAEGPQPIAASRAPEGAAAARAAHRGSGRSPQRSAEPEQLALPYSFESFVVGDCNALAREAALALARRRQGMGLLFLASAQGLGKTHLACSVVREARVQGASRVVYAPAESFTSQLMASIRNRSTDDFKRRYRHCELLVLEDVQFLAGKRATQLELFHTLQHLRAVGRPVLLTADRVPARIGDFDARTASLLASGLVAEIEPPDAGVRRAILRTKAASGGVRIPETCLERLVEEVRGSVRDLEGVLTQLVSTAALLQRPIDLELTDAALRKLRPASRGPLRPEQVASVVASFFGTNAEALAKRSRRRDVIVPRKLAMYLCHRYTDASATAIGRAFGRQHAAVRNAVASVERELLERAPLRYQFEALCERLEAERRRGGR